MITFLPSLDELISQTRDFIWDNCYNLSSNFNKVSPEFLNSFSKTYSVYYFGGKNNSYYKKFTVSPDISTCITQSSKSKNDIYKDISSYLTDNNISLISLEKHIPKVINALEFFLINTIKFVSSQYSSNKYLIYINDNKISSLNQNYSEEDYHFAHNANDLFSVISCSVSNLKFSSLPVNYKLSY